MVAEVVEEEEEEEEEQEEVVVEASCTVMIKALIPKVTLAV